MSTATDALRPSRGSGEYRVVILIVALAVAIGVLMIGFDWTSEGQIEVYKLLLVAMASLGGVNTVSRTGLKATALFRPPNTEATPPQK